MRRRSTALRTMLARCRAAGMSGARRRPPGSLAAARPPCSGAVARPPRLVAGPVGAAVGAPFGPLAAATEIPLELLGDRLAARFGCVDGVARLFQLRAVAGHLLVVSCERVDALLPRLRVGLEASAGDGEAGELFELAEEGEHRLRRRRVVHV